MSKENVKKMFAEIEKDSNLQKKYGELMLAHRKETEKVLSDKLVELGRTSGFAYSKDDLMEARAELVDMANSGGELSEKDLTGVAGGGAKKTNAIVKSIYSLGLVCAINSLVALKNCPAEMTTSDPNCKNT